jgi:phosphatidylinositol glycan class H protein
MAAEIPVVLLLPVSLLIFYAIVLRVHTTESLLVLRGLGIQTSATATTYLGTASTRFIPTEKIQDVFVNEAFRGFEVRYYLVVVVEDEEEVVVVFPRLLPRRAIVEKVWRGARECLYEPEKICEANKQSDVG